MTREEQEERRELGDDLRGTWWEEIAPDGLRRLIALRDELLTDGGQREHICQVGDVDVSVRAYNALRRAGLMTPAALAGAGARGVALLDGMGLTTYNEIAAAMRARGHDWPIFGSAWKMYSHFGFDGAKWHTKRRERQTAPQAACERCGERPGVASAAAPGGPDWVCGECGDGAGAAPRPFGEGAG